MIRSTVEVRLILRKASPHRPALVPKVGGEQNAFKSTNLFKKKDAFSAETQKEDGAHRVLKACWNL